MWRVLNYCGLTERESIGLDLFFEMRPIDARLDQGSTANGIHLKDTIELFEIQCDNAEVSSNRGSTPPTTLDPPP